MVAKTTQIDIRDAHDKLEDPPLYSGSEADVREWVECHPDWDVWFFVRNAEGTTETVSREEFMEAGG